MIRRSRMTDGGGALASWAHQAWSWYSSAALPTAVTPWALRSPG